MVKLVSISLLFKSPSDIHLISTSSDVSSFSYFQRSGIKEFLNFTTKIIIERTQFGQRQSVKEREYMCHSYVRKDGLSALLVADDDYPTRVAFTILSKVCDDFISKTPKDTWLQSTYSLEGVLQKYQNPKDADAMTRVQAELDETKVILHNTMESLMQRGEKLDDLVSKSDELSDQSKYFYKQAKQVNSWCCVIQ